MDSHKQAEHDFWNAASCGEALYLRGTDRHAYADQATMRKQLDGTAPLMGRVHVQALLNSIPSALWPSKVVQDTDELMANIYGFVPDDFPTNSFATSLVDFGVASVLFVPVLILAPILFVSAAGRRADRYPAFLLFACGLVIRYLLNIENAPADIFVPGRDLAIFALIFLCPAVLTRARALARNPTRRVRNGTSTEQRRESLG